ncbi:TRAP transporter small permease [Veronia pacifica]|uniref:TRAP transporter small permease protein n=1 Tax=Veronia pacifica TaxID=1080227 RepID=A0A1C3ESQ9_9GAMM|nr:TRAP transporter small permease [Veronia pacifica]ODA36244.1 C4-dicarboxylate ABC transporter permease [Veronia pacifica]
MDKPTPSSGSTSLSDVVEETLIAILLGAMTLLTFANVISRYVFNDNILWALELTVFIFAWLVLIGASYGVKKHFHIGVDVLLEAVSPRWRHVLALISVSVCILFSVLLFIGSWNYWFPFVTERAWYETDDIPMPEMLQFLAGWLNEGERYEKLPRFIPYFVLPLATALLTVRFLQLGYQVVTGKLDRVISSHEVDDELEKFKHAAQGSDVNADKEK